MSGHKIQVFIDNTKKFITDEVLRKEQIHIRNGAPYVPAHQGKIERAGQTLMTSARALGIDAELPDTLWPLFMLLPTSANTNNIECCYSYR